MIEVTIRSPDVDLAPHWDDLVSRAQPNVFMSPAALKAARDTMFAHIHVLLAWDRSAQPHRLAGLWALRQTRIVPLWPAILEALPYEYAFLSTPVVDPAFAAEVMPAFVKAVASTPGMPRVITLKSMDSEARSFIPLLQAIEREGASLILKTESRPIVWRHAQTKLSGERRKKLRQSWKRLCALGTTEIVYHKEMEAVCEAFESFLQLELNSWKGAAGTALLCKAVDAAFVRRLIRNLAERDKASVDTLKVDGKVVAAQVVLFSGTMGYTWKTAYDADYAKYSPGVLLIDAMTEDLFATTAIEGVDSCSVEGSFMGQLWGGRRAMVDMLIDVGPGKSPSFVLEAVRQVGREHLKQWRNRIRGRLATPKLKSRWPRPIPTA